MFTDPASNHKVSYILGEVSWGPWGPESIMHLFIIRCVTKYCYQINISINYLHYGNNVHICNTDLVRQLVPSNSF